MELELLQKYVDGKCTRAELKRISIWLRESQANEDFFISFIQTTDLELRSHFEDDVQKEWEVFKNRLSSKEVDKHKRSELTTFRQSSELFKRKVKKRQFKAWGYSLASFLLIFISIAFINYRAGLLKEDVEVVETPYKVIETSRGERSNIQLNDGTRIVLNSSSTLLIPLNFGPGNREIFLDGEAFFEVIHNEGSPFTVIASDKYVRDIGTKFNVLTSDSASIEVAVVEGVVALGKMKNGVAQNEMAELTENKLGRLEDEGEVRVSDIEHIEVYTGWAENKLVFQRTPLSEVMQRLEEWFDVECDIDALSNTNERTLTATYHGVSLHEVLNVLSMTMNITYTQEGKKITFNEK